MQANLQSIISILPSLSASPTIKAFYCLNLSSEHKCSWRRLTLEIVSRSFSLIRFRYFWASHELKLLILWDHFKFHRFYVHLGSLNFGLSVHFQFLDFILLWNYFLLKWVKVLNFAKLSWKLRGPFLLLRLRLSFRLKRFLQVSCFLLIVGANPKWYRLNWAGIGLNHMIKSVIYLLILGLSSLQSLSHHLWMI